MIRNNYILYYLIIFFLIFSSCNVPKKNKEIENKDELSINDNHVHIMSPSLIKDWKNLGITFSKPNEYYSNIDTILKNNKAHFTNLIGMGYVYGISEFNQDREEYQNLKQENNYVLEVSKNQEQKLKPFIAVNPLKDYAINEIKRCLKLNSKLGLKLHFNASQVYLTELIHLKKIKLIFKLASENDVPILLHFDNWHPKFGKPDIKILVNNILKDLDHIHLTIAHFGTSGGFNKKTKNVIDAFLELQKNSKILKKHTILFDISAVALDKDSEGVKKLTENNFSELKIYCDKIGYDKIVFGTDYPLYTSNEYFEILKVKLKLSDHQLIQITN